MSALMPKRLRGASATLSLICMSMFGSSQAATPPEHAAALQAIITAFEEQYVFPEMRPRIVQHLKDADRSGRYDTQDATEFAERITADLQKVSGDKHLWLSVDPAGYAAAISAGDESAREQALWQRAAVREHHGLTEMKVLSGNVRYLRVSRFDWLNDQTGAAYDRAMSFLKDGDAVIIDLRGNGGGSHSAVRHLVSHFMDGDVLEMTFLEGSKPPVQSRTHEHLPAGRLKGMPLYVLIDLSSASAAEAFAYDVQQFKLGELVGGKTVGAANNNTLLPVAPQFILSLSYGRPVHPASNTNWEGVGVTPNVAADSTQALEVAHSLALKRLSEQDGVSEENLLEYTWARDAVEASLHPVTITKDRLQRLAGSYGSYKVEFRDGVLWLIRRDRAPARMSPMTADGLFSVERINSVRVKLTGKTLEVLRPGQPQPQVLPRT